MNEWVRSVEVTIMYSVRAQNNGFIVQRLRLIPTVLPLCFLSSLHNFTNRKIVQAGPGTRPVMPLLAGMGWRLIVLKNPDPAGRNPPDADVQHPAFPDFRTGFRHIPTHHIVYGHPRQLTTV